MRRSTALAALVLAACSAPTEAPAAHAPTPPTYAQTQDALRELFPEVEGEITRASIAAVLTTMADEARDATTAAVLAALDAGDLERAHEAIAARLTEDYVAQCRVLLDEDNPRDAMALLDRASALSPREPEVLRLRGEGALAIGLEDGDSLFLEDALDNFRRAARASGDPRAWVGASRAARQLYLTEEAIDYARRALPEPGAAVEASVSIDAQRALAEASFDAYIAERQGEPDAARTQELFETTRDVLEVLVDRSPDEAWGWLQLANLYQWQASPADARRALLSGLDHVPHDAALHERLVAVAGELGGSEAVQESYAEFQRKHPDVAAGPWYAGLDRFETALQELRAKADAAPRFEAAEASFARCRELAPASEESCLGYEVVCRAGAAWSHYEQGELEAAHRAFLSMDDLMPGRGLKWEYPGEFSTGVQGLAFVADASNALGRDPNGLERASHMERASKIFDFLHEYEPENIDWANNAGFFNRDTAVVFEQRARALARDGDIEQANRLLTRAREMMERSFRAYSDASELAPDDVRIVNDTGLIQTYYLQRDIPGAERYLMRAVELGEVQVPAARLEIENGELSEEERDEKQFELEALEVALGDAYQNLGVLYLTLKGDPKTARMWFQRSLEDGGPDPRPEVGGTGGYLDQCDAAQAGELDPVVDDAHRWGVPIAASDQ